MSTIRRGPLAIVIAVICSAGCSQGTPPESSTTAAATTPTAEPATTAAAATAPATDVATTLVANQWQLVTASDAAGQSIPAFFPSQDAPLGLLAADGRLNVTGGCNRISAGYTVADNARLEVGQARSTMMACPQPLADADAAMGKFLSGSLQAAVSGDAAEPQLQLTAADGSVLVFRGSPTPETRFGGPGTRAFLEVSTEPCAAPDSATGRCLTVRDIQFDDQGLKSGEPGAWRSLPEGIEGYTPVAGEQQVVRVKRFEQPGVAGAAATEHFVLDLVVQSRTVP